MKKWNQKIALFLLGGLATYAFAPDYFIIGALASFFIFFHFFNHAQSPKEAFKIGHLFGAGYFIFGLAWITNALQVDTYTYAHFGWLIPIFYLGCGVFMGLFFSLPAFLAQKYGKTKKMLIFPFLLTFWEWSREWIFTGLPWNRIGTIWLETPFIQSIFLIRTTGLTLMTLLSIHWIYKLFLTRKKIYIFPLIITFSTLFIYGKHRETLPLEFHKTRVKLIQSGLSQKLKWSYSQLEDNFNLHLNLSQEGESTDIVIWPESAVAFDLAHSSYYQNKVKEILSDQQILISGFIYRGKEIHNSLGVFTKNTGLNGLYHKHHLVPFGEYIPLANYLPLEAIAQGIGGIKAGNGIKTLSLPFDQPSVSPAICYEGIFSGQIVDTENPPEWILIITNDAWYGSSRGPYQHLAEAQLRAIEEGLPVVRVGYNGISAIISPTGKILQSISLGKQGTLTHKIPKRLPSFLFKNL